jgi:DNA replication and repair protein RecF
MKILNISLNDFRNYLKQSLLLSPGLNFLVGQNGEGKTNFLEAIYVLGLSKSYRSEDLDLIRFQCDYTKIKAIVAMKERQMDMQIVLSELGKKVLMNGQEVKRLSDYIGNLNIVLFAPEDLNLVKGSPVGRRYFFDIILGQVDRNYLKNLSDFKYVLKQRNELLKQMQSGAQKDTTLLDVITEQLSQEIEKIISARQKFIQIIGEKAAINYQFLTTKKDSFQLTYLPSISENILDTLKSRVRTDILSGTTNYGPHRDDFDFLLSDKSAKGLASQGEQRMIILAIDLAVIDYIFDLKNDKPIFLLDDVLSELDQEKQNRLLRYLISSGGQAIITTTGLNEIENDILRQSKIFKVAKGYIKEETHNGS